MPKRYHLDRMSEKPVSTHIDALLHDFCQQGRVQAGSLIITVFGDAFLPRGGRIWLGSLIRLLQPLDVNERLVRTSVFRLVKDEWLRTEAAGRRSDYLLTESGQRRFEAAARQIYAADIPLWDRRWRLILQTRDLDPRRREALRRALYWQGFGELTAGCFVHPGADLVRAFDALAAEGLQDLLPALMPLLAADPVLEQSASAPDMVARAWNLGDLAAAYEVFTQRYRPLLGEASAAPALDPERAFLARILLIHDFRRLLLRDPQLPADLLPADWPGQRARALCRELYRRLLAPSELHLDRCMQLASGATPPASRTLESRFLPSDPLAAGI
ncbi:MAG: hypothetical protein RJA36_755 [Pseudomonadota bacterium]